MVRRAALVALASAFLFLCFQCRPSSGQAFLSDLKWRITMQLTQDQTCTIYDDALEEKIKTYLTKRIIAAEEAKSNPTPQVGINVEVIEDREPPTHDCTSMNSPDTLSGDRMTMVAVIFLSMSLQDAVSATQSLETTNLEIVSMEVIADDTNIPAATTTPEPDDDGGGGNDTNLYLIIACAVLGGTSLIAGIVICNFKLRSAVPATSSVEPSGLTFCSFLGALFQPSNIANRFRDHLSTSDEFSPFFAHPNICKEYSRRERFAVWTLVLLCKFVAAQVLAESDNLTDIVRAVLAIFAAEFWKWVTLTPLVKYVLTLGIHDPSCWKSCVKFVAHIMVWMWYLLWLFILVGSMVIGLGVDSEACNGSRNITGETAKTVTSDGVESRDEVDLCQASQIGSLILFVLSWLGGSLSSFVTYLVFGAPLCFAIGSCECAPKMKSAVQKLLALFIPEWALTTEMHKQALRPSEPDDLWFVTCCVCSSSPAPPLSWQSATALHSSSPGLHGRNPLPGPRATASLHQV